MKKTQKAFTLVELIVVITILAILWTIAFISLSGYSADARNSKRTSDVNSIRSAVSTKQTEWVYLLSMVTSVTARTLTTIDVAGTWATSSDYVAWTPNFTVLGIKNEDFQDPNGQDYSMAATSKINWKFELAATIENGSWEKSAKVEWTYVPRTTAFSLTVPNINGWKTVVIDDADVNKLQKGDTVTDGNSDVTISAVSSDLTTLTFSDTTLTGTTLTFGNGTATDETAGLIDATTSATDTPVEDGATWDSAVPY